MVRCLSILALLLPQGFTPTPEAPAMPKALMKLPRTNIARAKFPAIDFHLHGRGLATAEDYRKMIQLMDATGLGVLCNMDGGFGKTFDQNMKVGEPFRDRIIHFARVDFNGINEPGWSGRAAAELDRCFRAGAAGLKINKVLGLDLKHPDGTYIQSDDPRFDPIWEMCAKHNKPVMIHTSDSFGRFLPIGPENERYEAGLWRSSPEGNYYKTGHPSYEVIERARENMHRKHPKTRFVNAHVAMLYYDMDKVTALLDKYPNADVEISASVQDLGRAPRLIREFFLKYQDRILFGSDGNPRRGIEEFWVPHWRFLETFDEHFDHPAQLRGPTGAPLHGRWRIYGIGLPDDVLRKVYYGNALRYLPSVRASIEKQLAARRAENDRSTDAEWIKARYGDWGGPGVRAAPGPMDAVALKDYAPKPSLIVPETPVLKARYPAIDAHTHVSARTPAEVAEWVRTMDEVGIETSVVLTGATGAEFDKLVDLYLKPYPGRFQLYCGLERRDIDKPDYPDRAAQELARCYRLGARGVGEITDKGSGLNRAKVHPDDARMDRVWQKCAELKIPVSLHVADHPSCWTPLDVYQERTPDYQHFNQYGQEGLNHAELIAVRNRTLARHSKTIFLACHLGNQGHDLAALAKELDRYPNLYLDISARDYEVGRQPRMAAKFLAKYQDRILFGTDMGRQKPMYRAWWRLLESADEFMPGRVWWRYYGLELPAPVLENLYRGNARRILNWTN